MKSATQRLRATPSLHAQVRRESKRAPKRRLQNGGESFYVIEIIGFRPLPDSTPAALLRIQRLQTSDQRKSKFPTNSARRPTQDAYVDHVSLPQTAALFRVVGARLHLGLAVQSTERFFTSYLTLLRSPRLLR